MPQTKYYCGKKDLVVKIPFMSIGQLICVVSKLVYQNSSQPKHMLDRHYETSRRVCSYYSYCLFVESPVQSNGDRLSSQAFFVVFLNPSRQIPGQCFKLRYRNFLPHPSQFTVRRTILSFDTIQSQPMTCITKRTVN
jgi:hypothetical protein